MHVHTLHLVPYARMQHTLDITHFGVYVQYIHMQTIQQHNSVTIVTRLQAAWMRKWRLIPGRNQKSFSTLQHSDCSMANLAHMDVKVSFPSNKQLQCEAD